MKRPSASPIFVAATALLMSTGAIADPKSATGKPVPTPPAEVLKQGGDAVVDWMLQNGHATPEMLRKHAGDKACEAVADNREAEIPFRTPLDDVEKPTLLQELETGFNSLSSGVFKHGVKPHWKSVAAKFTPKILDKIENLIYPKIYGTNMSGELVVGDGVDGMVVLMHSQDQNYFEIYSNGREQAQADGYSFMTIDEYRSFYPMNLSGLLLLESGDLSNKLSFPIVGYPVDGHAHTEIFTGPGMDGLKILRVMRVRI